MPPAAPLSCRRKRGERRVGAGDSDFPRPDTPPLETANQGAAAPLLDVPPRKGGYASPSGAAGALQRKPPPSESRQQDGSGETPRRGNRNSPFLVVSRGMGVGKGENRNFPFPTGSFAPFWPLRKGSAGGMTRKQVSKRVTWKVRQPGTRRADVGIGPYAGKTICGQPQGPPLHSKNVIPDILANKATPCIITFIW